MESYHAHQLILPTDKRNPCFSLYATEDQQSISVFYGLELMEVVPDGPDQMAFKMLAGRLYTRRHHKSSPFRSVPLSWVCPAILSVGAALYIPGAVDIHIGNGHTNLNQP